MSKSPIAWHERCLANREKVLLEDRARLEDLARDVARAQQQIDFYKTQIKTAVERKMDGFDQDRFLVPKVGSCKGQTLKVFTCSYDGRNDKIVAARSMLAASILTGISYSHFRVYGHETFNDTSCRIALASPGTVFGSPINSDDWKEVPPKKG
jgi:hypothetical protein